MKKTILSYDEQRTLDARWRRVFIIWPRQVAEKDVRYLEYVEVRYLPCGAFPHGFCQTQYRAIGSNVFWPEYPFLAGEAPISKEEWAAYDKRRLAQVGEHGKASPPMPPVPKPARRYADIKPVPPTEHDYFHSASTLE